MRVKAKYRHCGSTNILQYICWHTLCAPERTEYAHSGIPTSYNSEVYCPSSFAMPSRKRERSPPLNADQLKFEEVYQATQKFGPAQEHLSGHKYGDLSPTQFNK